VNLGSAALALQKAGGVQIDGPITLIDNDGTDDVNGTFAGLPEGAMVDVGDRPFRLTYAGGSGNDVTIASTELTYFLAEGSTGAFFDTEIAIANPHNAVVPVMVEFLVEGGGQVITQDYQLAPMSRTSVSVDAIPGLESAAVSTKVRSTTALPIVVECTMWWSGETRYGAHTEKASGGVAERWYFAEGSQGFFFTFLLLATPRDAEQRPQWYEAHNSFGVTQTALRWGLAEGRVGEAAGYQTYVLLANPTANAATVTIVFLRESGAPIAKQFTVNPSSPLNVSVGPGTDVPELTNERFGALIRSSVPIVVERAMYANAGAQVWGAGTNATATRLP
jgi:hypothetical protein